LFDFGRNLLFQTAQSDLRTNSISFTLHQTKVNSYINICMHIAEEWGINNAGENWEGMQLKKVCN
jgi:hypothetical protein